MPEIKYFEK
ncbi:hypothetical protein U9M48_018795 [Paspalum notatum var. saurae]|uniref:Uncharacterized protein n=1 Tax=Paspalum notatum var. saurae TaxID=547442 RepID=A0AAQ3TCA1_PASNO